MHSIWLLLSGLGAGLLAGLLGIGGGTVLVLLLVALERGYDQAVATSSWAIVITSTSGTLQNWRMGYLDARRVALLGLPAVLTAQVGALWIGQLPEFLKEAAFGILLLVTIALGTLRRRLLRRPADREDAARSDSKRLLAQLGTGAAAGLLAGIFGVGGGVIMVPLQMLLLNEPIKLAIQTSLGVIVITSFSATAGHALQGNVLWLDGLLLGLGGLLGAQVSTRFLPRLPDRVVSFCFNLLLVLSAFYFFWRATQSYGR